VTPAWVVRDPLSPAIEFTTFFDQPYFAPK